MREEGIASEGDGIPTSLASRATWSTSEVVNTSRGHARRACADPRPGDHVPGIPYRERADITEQWRRASQVAGVAR
jgi:hypothetical protein